LTPRLPLPFSLPLQALLEEADIKLSEISKDAYEFKRDVGSSAPGKPVSEKVLHFLEDKLRTKDSVVDKLTLKNAALKQQILKLENQLQVSVDETSCFALPWTREPFVTSAPRCLTRA
jgi:hypothetical protein